MISHSTKEGPVEGMVAILVGKAVNSPNMTAILYAVGAVTSYLALFMWYARKMKIRNRVYLGEEVPDAASDVPKVKNAL